MKTADDLELYMLEMGLSFERVQPNTFVINDGTDHPENLVVHHADPVVVFRVKLFDLGDGDNSALLRRLLELNAAEMIAGAYGVEGGSVVIVDTLQAENLDQNEFQASVEAITLALTQHYPELAGLRHGAEAN